MPTILIGLGSNKPWWRLAPAQIIHRAAAAVGRLGEGMVLSSLYRTDAWPDPSGPAYVNAALRLETPLSPEAVMAALLAIEAGFGRQRSDDPALRYAPRSLDLDLLDYEGERRESEELMLPHPRLDDRIFVLKPLAEIAPGWRHPLTGRGIGELLAAASGRADRLPFTGAALS